jgi:cephalosporin hydroxylase
MENDKDRMPGLDLYTEIFDHPWLFPLQRKAEMAAMMKLARSIEPKTVMEIGSDKGGSFYHWVKGQET